MSDDNNIVVETTEEIQKAERAKKLKRRSSIGRFFDGVKSLLGLSTGNYDDETEVEEKQVEETEVKTEQRQDEDNMDVEVAEDEDPEVDFAEEDEFLAEGEEVRPDPKLQAIKKMNLPKKEKIALSKQRSEELLEEDIKRVSQDEESSYTETPKPVRRGGRPKKVARGRKATTKAAKSPARSRSTSPSKSPSRSRSASPAKKTPGKRGGARKTPAKSPAKSTSTSPSRSRSASPAKKTPARTTRKTPAKSAAKSPAKSPKTPRATRKTPAKVKAETRTPRTVGRKRKAEDPAEGESPVKKAKVTRRKSAPAKKREETKPGVTVTWPNTVLRQSYKGGKTFYSSVTVNGKKFSLGDTIYLISETGEEYIGIIENLYETKTGRNRAEIQWYYKHEETNSNAKPVKGEVYQSDHIDANPIESFVLDRTPVVTHEDKIKDLKAYLAKPDHYYYNRFYDHDAKKFHNAKKDK